VLQEGNFLEGDNHEAPFSFNCTLRSAFTNGDADRTVGFQQFCSNGAAHISSQAGLDLMIGSTAK
jgi:hypothetical protein